MTKDTQFRIADFASALPNGNKKQEKWRKNACKDRPSAAKSFNSTKIALFRRFSKMYSFEHYLREKEQQQQSIAPFRCPLTALIDVQQR